MATQTKQTVAKVKLGGGGQDVSRIKKIESSSKQLADSKNKSVSTSVRISNFSPFLLYLRSAVWGSIGLAFLVKSSTSSTSKATTTTKTARVKKVFSLAGQKYDPPEEREPVRIFYESLSEQIPSSEMAEFWMMEHGLLSPERSKKAYEKKQRKQKMQRMGTPIKSPKTPSKPESSSHRQQLASSKKVDIKSKRRLADDSDDDDNLVLSAKRRKG
ncbi:unnamed protein product [Linum tenue]|uniref:Uncharacterized protein n=1 Tax=Linum tenue TaxID=586396 RepID=A0AAV0M3P8_9ROSI|nr:unnamed protein product [Linum tenue]